ncbi:hypothetical protein AALP_AA8G172300 [Arabis alpina]|uniref:Uncharacterized protein n=1 Tax=Arabis alpina TaxID=50452 RepID=A0A087G7L4_ARAAL|nr:hypothetical protein AALP_AA8G172300 [Arabis alpina]
MVTEEEESEAANLIQSSEIIPAVANLITTVNASTGQGEIEGLPVTNLIDLVNSMGEKIIGDDENEEDWGKEDWGEEDEDQYMEDLLNNDDLLGYDMLCEEKQLPNPISDIPNPVAPLDDEQENIEIAIVDGTDDNRSMIDPIPEDTIPNTSPLPVSTISTKKKNKPQTSLIGFGVKNKILQVRASSKGNNKKRLGLNQSHQQYPRKLGLL